MSTEYERPGLVHVLIRERDEARNALHLAEFAAALALDERDRLIRENGGLREVIRGAHEAILEARECVYGEVSSWNAVNINLPKSLPALAKPNPFTTP
jgi:hypothetical protein